MANITTSKNKKGETVFRFRVFLGISPDGKQKFRSKTWRPETAMTPKQAEREAQKQAALFEAQFSVETKRGMMNTRIKFQHLAEEWFSMVEQTGQMKVSSIIRLKSCTNRLYQALGNQYVDNISYRMIQQFILSLAKDGMNQNTGKGLSAKSQKHFITLISDIMRYAKKCGYITDNPCKDIEVQKAQTKERCPYTLDKEITFLNLMQEHNAPLRYQVFFRFLIYHGLRRGEVLGLEWKDIDFSTGICCINRTSSYQNSKTGVYTSTPKTKSSRRNLRLSDELLSYLRRYKMEKSIARVLYSEKWQDSDRLFTTETGAPLTPNTPYSWLQRFCERYDLPFKGLHSFRHAFASEMIASKQVDIKTVSAILGHSQTSTTLNIYAHEVQTASAAAQSCVYDLIEARRKNA